MTSLRHLPLLLLAPLGLLLVAAPAGAMVPGIATQAAPQALPGVVPMTTVAEVVQALRSDPVYVDAKAELRTQVQVSEVQAQLGKASAAIFVAVLPAAAARNNNGCSALITTIDKQLGQGTVLLGVCGRDFAGVAAPGSGLASGVAPRIARDRGDASQVTRSLVAAIADVQAAAANTAANGTTSTASGDTGGGGGYGGAVLLGVLSLGAAGGGAFLYSRSRRRRLQELEGMRADVESLYDRLGNDVSTLSPGDDPIARQALADAAERYSSTGALMAKSDTPGEWAAARRTAVEGLTAARVVRQKLGLDPGPEVPPPPSAGPQLQQAGTFQVGDQQVAGSPTYQPGQSHYYGGGQVGGHWVPGGWYSMPFWETALMASVLTGGFGGFGGGFGGGGYDRGYDQGYDAGQDSGERQDSGAGDRGGGGDWGGGGGGGSGGDWGGGGGDSGGGGGGGGDGGSW